LTYEVKTWFQNCSFKFNLHRYGVVMPMMLGETPTTAADGRGLSHAHNRPLCLRLISAVFALSQLIFFSLLLLKRPR
jgi:hypothetical protein